MAQITRHLKNFAPRQVLLSFSNLIFFFLLLAPAFLTFHYFRFFFVYVFVLVYPLLCDGSSPGQDHVLLSKGMRNESSRGHRKPRALAANDDHLVKGPTASMSLSWVASPHPATPQWPGSCFTLRNARLAWQTPRSVGLRFRLCVLTCLPDHDHQLSSTETSSICCHYQTPLSRSMGLRNGE